MIGAEAPGLASTALLLVSDAELRALLELGRSGTASGPDLAGPTAAGWVVNGHAVGVLADALAALTAPVCELELQRGERRGWGVADEDVAMLITPGPQPGVHQLVVVPTQFLPDALCRLNDLAPRPRVQPAVRLRYAASDLARILASRDAALATELAGDAGSVAASQLVSSLREHWRIEVRWTPAGAAADHRVLEVLDTDRGIWLVVPDDDVVELWPSTPTKVFRELIKLLPDVSEFAQAPAG